MAIKIKKRYKKRSLPQELVNERIRFPRVLVIDTEGKNLGEMNTNRAKELAFDKGLDLICIKEPKDGSIPITKIQDYGKFKYEKSKKVKEAKRNQQIVENKEIRLTVNIGTHDMGTKAKKAIEFLDEGNRVKISLKFKGREMQHKQIGQETIMKFFEMIKEHAIIEKEPKLNTRFLDMYLAPINKKK